MFLLSYCDHCRQILNKYDLAEFPVLLSSEV